MMQPLQWLMFWGLVQAVAVTSLPPAPSLTCDFEDGMCGWRASPSIGYMFRRQNGFTPDRTSGPDGDHTLQDCDATVGHYVFSSGWDADNRTAVASLLSPEVRITEPSHLSVWYQMNGNGVGSLALILHQRGTKSGAAATSTPSVAWNITGRQGLSWGRRQVHLPPGFWQVEFQSTVRLNYGSDIALDDIQLVPSSAQMTTTTPAPCPTTTTTTTTTTTPSTTTTITSPTTPSTASPTPSSTTSSTSRRPTSAPASSTTNTPATTGSTKKTASGNTPSITTTTTKPSTKTVSKTTDAARSTTTAAATPYPASSTEEPKTKPTTKKPFDVVTKKEDAVRPPSSPTPTRKTKTNTFANAEKTSDGLSLENRNIVIGVCVGAVVLAILVAAAVFAQKSGKSAGRVTGPDGSSSSDAVQVDQETGKVTQARERRWGTALTMLAQEK